MNNNIRITITINYSTLERLLELARREGLSIGRIASLIVEEYSCIHDDGLRPGREGGK